MALATFEAWKPFGMEAQMMQGNLDFTRKFINRINLICNLITCRIWCNSEERFYMEAQSEFMIAGDSSKYSFIAIINKPF